MRCEKRKKKEEDLDEKERENKCDKKKGETKM
jgi:hypothetical protein